MHVSNERLDRSFRVEGPKRATRPRMRRRAGPEVPGPMYDPRDDPNHPHTAPSGRWGPTPGAAAPPPGRGDDALVTVAGWVLAAVATFTLATTAAVSFAVVFGAATGRRWRWWPLVVAG